MWIQPWIYAKGFCHPALRRKFISLHWQQALVQHMAQKPVTNIAAARHKNSQKVISKVCVGGKVGFATLCCLRKGRWVCYKNLLLNCWLRNTWLTIFASYGFLKCLLEKESCRPIILNRRKRETKVFSSKYVLGLQAT